MIRILVVDDHTLFRESLGRLLNAETGLRVIGEHAGAESALRAIATGLAFDVALIDYDLPGSGGVSTSGISLCETIAGLRPEARLLMVTAGMPTLQTQHVIQDLRIGLFLKTEPIAELLLAIRRTARGEQWISSTAALSILRGADQRRSEWGFEDLTARGAVGASLCA